MPDLRTVVDGMDAATLDMYKRDFRQRISSFSQEQQQTVFSRLEGIPQLEDLLPRRETPWYSKPFEYIHKNIEEPFTAIALAAASPPVPGTEDLGWLERQKREYEAWEAPTIKTGMNLPGFLGGEELTFGVKGAAEMLPWLAVPGPFGAYGKLASVGAKSGLLGTAARVAAKAIKPAAMAEKALIAEPIAKLTSIIGAAKKAQRVLKPIRAGELSAKFGASEEAWRAGEGVTGFRAGLGKMKGELTPPQFEFPGVKPPVTTGVKGSRAVRDFINANPQLNNENLYQQIRNFARRNVGKSPKEQEINLIKEFGKDPEITLYRGISPSLRPHDVLSDTTSKVGRFWSPNPAHAAQFIRGGGDIYSVTLKASDLLKRDLAKISHGEIQLNAVLQTGATKLTPEAGMPQTLIEQLTEKDVADLFNIVRDVETVSYGDKITLGKALQKIVFEQQVPQPHEIKLIEKVFGSELAGSLEGIGKTGTKKAFETALDVANAPRAILASWDLSGLLRQGGILATRHPIEAAKSSASMLKAFMSEKSATIIDDLIRGRKNFALGQEAGLYIAPLPEKVGTALARREEMFMSRFAQKFPLVKRSERAFVTVLNEMRSRVWENTTATWEKMGQKATQVDYEDLAKFINYATGRGNMGKLGTGNLGPLLNATLFAPKLILSRIQLPTLLFSKSPLVRKEAWQTLATFLGTGTSLLAILKLGGAEIELDPRSADFAKAKIGNTRLDFWTGYQQYARFLSQLVVAQRKTQAGNIMDLNRKEVVDRFFQSKFSPAFGLLNDILKGESYMGEEMALDTKSIGKQAFNRLVPLFVQDMTDAINQEGLIGGFVASPGLFGVGVVTYTDDVDKTRQKLAGEVGKTWEQLDREQQILLEKESPELKAAMDERELKTEGTTYGDYAAYGRNIESTYQKTIMDKVAKYKSTGDAAQFRKDIDLVAYARRMMYANRDTEEKFADIVARREEIKPEELAKLPANDRARRAYYDSMYADDMFDQFGEYRYDEADKRRTQFIQIYGQESLDYVERVMGLKWDEPAELKQLREARKILKPYWEGINKVWSMYPPEIKEIADQISIMENTNPLQAKALAFKYPQILMARKMVASYKKQIKAFNPQIAFLINKYYSY